MPEIFDDKSEHCIPFLLERLKQHQARYANDPNAPPFFLGLNGVQGVGKTVLVSPPLPLAYIQHECEKLTTSKVSTLQKLLKSPPYSLPTVTLSLDDIYLTHADQLALANSHPDNSLIQHRGQPSTHDLSLGKKVFESLRANLPTAIPQYDKSAFAGQGDRVPESSWEVVNKKGEEKIKAVIFEGWCVGFRPLDDEILKQKWEDAVRQRNDPAGKYEGRLGYVKLGDVKAINDALREYDVLTDHLDAFIHIDAQNSRFVYDWRQEQERTLIAAKGTGMTEEQVNHFVDGCTSPPFPSIVSRNLSTNLLFSGM
ncbi:hypothetical protein ZTR_05820 [Talaromyces verruculosus]|nr:hypothetical protein ZTR_05820 [Talaromyces verruculosus]